MTAFANSRVAADKADVAVRVLGTGPTLVLLPGLGRSSHDLDVFAEHLAAAGYRAVLPGSRGMDGSTGRLDGITLHDLARDIAAVIEALCDGPAVVIGHAFGNRIARCLAADRQELISLVVLLSSSGKVQPTPEIAEAIRLAQAVDTPADIRAAAVLAAWFAPGSDITPWLDGWSQPVMHAYLAAAAATPMNDWWTAGTADILIVQGLCDVSAPVGNGRLLRDEIGDRATLIELADVGHALPVEKPTLLANTVVDFLRSRTANRSSRNG
ncbi:MAG: alpha/beta hydrolase [Acetobacteraceae bacterium]|jgi:pimeloyl-ACP methyl ester carboxylesterase